MSNVYTLNRVADVRLLFMMFYSIFVVLNSLLVPL